jgi:hypothetical protein
VKARLVGIADEEKDVYEADQSNSPRSAIPLDKQFPRTYITVAIPFVRKCMKENIWFLWQ